jgi:anti-sigma factor RsiW
MKTHMTDEDLAAVVADLGLAPETEEHLSSCLSCRHEVADLRRFVADRREGMAAEFPDWQRQRQEVLARLADLPTARPAPARRWLRPLLAAAAVVVVAVGVGLLMPHGAATPPATDDLAVEQILAEVDAVLADDSLPGFESIDPGVDDPASLFENGSS